MILEKDVADHVSQLLNIDNEELSGESNLLEFGLHSLALMQLVEVFRAKYCKAIEYTDFVMAPSIGEWTELLNSAIASSQQQDGVAIADGHSESRREPVEIPLSDMQYAYWSGCQGGGVSAHLYVEFEGKNINLPRFKKAIDAVFSAHPILCLQVSDQGMQKIGDFPQGKELLIDDCSAYQAAELQKFLTQKRKRITHQRMRVDLGQVIDISLTLLPGNCHRLHIDVDMIAIDAPSFLILVSDIAQFYENGSDEFVPKKMDFFDYLRLSEQDVTRKRELNEHKHWWNHNLLKMPDAPKLPLIPEGLRGEVRSDSLSCYLSKKESQSLQQLAKNSGLSITSILLSVFSAVLANWSGEKKFRLNFPVFKRKNYTDDVAFIVGDFSSFLLLGVDLEEDSPLGLLGQKLDRDINAALAHSNYAGINLLRDLSKLTNTLELAPVVFTSGMDLQELFSPSVLTLLGRPIWCVSQGPKVDLDVQVAWCEEQVFVNWDIRLDAFKGNVATDMFSTYISAIKHLAQNPAALQGSSSQLLLPSRLRELEKDAATGVHPVVAAKFTLFISHLEKLLQKNLESPALIVDRQSISYGQLAQQLQNIAGNLLLQGITRSDKVAILLDCPQTTIPLMFALLSLGIAFVPVPLRLTEDLSAKQLDLLLGNIGCCRVISQDQMQLQNTQTLLADLLKPCALQPADTLYRQLASIAESDIAFYSLVQKDSGEWESVPVFHAALAHTFVDISASLGLGEDSRCVSLSNLESDTSIAEMITVFSVSATLVIVDRIQVSTPGQWLDVIKHHAATHILGAAARVSALIKYSGAEELLDVACWLMCGDRIPASLIKHFKASDNSARLLLLVGAANRGIYSVFSVSANQSSAGSLNAQGYIAHSHCQYRIINGDGQECPSWVEGQLWLCIGKLNAETAAEHYKGLPLLFDDKAQAWLATGINASHTDQSEIVFSGNHKAIIKRQGYYIDLTDLENIIISIANIHNAVLIPVQQEFHQTYVAAIEPLHSHFDLQAIKHSIGKVLPDYLMPEHIFMLGDLAVNGDGIIDYAEVYRQYQFISQHGSDAGSSSLENASALQRVIIYICSKIVGADSRRLLLDDDFFEQGGDSLLATHLTASINQYFKGANLTVVDVFSLRTLRKLAERIDDKLPTLANGIAEVFLTVIEDEQ